MTTAAVDVQVSPAEALTIGTLLHFWAGQREAIIAIARNKSAVWLGALFVLTAAFAREYDHVDLLSEPGHLAIPFAASLATSFVLFQVVWGVASLRDRQGIDFWPAYRSFLGLYWMTAPLAWLYAIPVERFLSLVGATEANLWLLGIVSVWRVALITCVVSTVFSARWFPAFLVVMFFADTLVLVLLYFADLPMIDLMGGIHLNDSERLIANVAFEVGVLAFLSWILWLIAALVVASTWKIPWRWAIEAPTALPISRGTWALGAGVLLLFLSVLPVTQSEQRLQSLVDRDLRAARLAEAIDTMSAHEPADFPSDWDPPPRLGHREPAPELFDVLEAIIARNAPEWVWRKFSRKAEQLSPYPQMLRSDPPLTHEQWLERLLTRLDALPTHTPEQLDRRIQIVEQIEQSWSTRYPGLQPKDRERLEGQIKQWRAAASKL